jgi:hypothetical protein
MGKEMKKKGFLDYGKDDDEPAGKKEEDDQEDDSEDDGGAHEKRIAHLAEQTGVDNPKALVKLIKACMAARG